MTKLKPLKKTIKLSLALIMLYGLNACSKADTPQAVSIAFANALAKGKITESTTYTTEVSANFLKKASALANVAPRPDANYEVVKDSIYGNKGFVEVIDKGQKKPKLEHFDVVKIDGVWKVTLEDVLRKGNKKNRNAYR